jgi:hypothetical protein
LSSSSPIYFLFVRLGNIDPSSWRDNHDGAAVAVPTFPVTLYVLLISYLALVIVLFADLLDVFACMHVVK